MRRPIRGDRCSRPSSPPRPPRWSPMATGDASMERGGETVTRATSPVSRSFCTSPPSGMYHSVMRLVSARNGWRCHRDVDPAPAVSSHLGSPVAPEFTQLTGEFSTATQDGDQRGSMEFTGTTAMCLQATGWRGVIPIRAGCSVLFSPWWFWEATRRIRRRVDIRTRQDFLEQSPGVPL